MPTSFEQPFGEKLVAGDRWKWTVALADYPADAWRLKYFFRGTSSLNLVSAADGTTHLLNALPVDTGKLESGSYAWQAAVEKISDATEHYELARGMVEVLADIEKATAGGAVDFRSENQRNLDAIRKTIAGTASREERQYQIGGRSLELRSIKELLDLEGVFAARVRQEQVGAGVVKPQHNQVHVRFGGPS